MSGSDAVLGSLLNSVSRKDSATRYSTASNETGLTHLKDEM